MIYNGVITELHALFFSVHTIDCDYYMHRLKMLFILNELQLHFFNATTDFLLIIRFQLKLF